jgi:hypothetical protein
LKVDKEARGVVEEGESEMVLLLLLEVTLLLDEDTAVGKDEDTLLLDQVAGVLLDTLLGADEVLLLELELELKLDPPAPTRVYQLVSGKE